MMMFSIYPKQECLLIMVIGTLYDQECMYMHGSQYPQGPIMAEYSGCEDSIIPLMHEHSGFEYRLGL